LKTQHLRGLEAVTEFCNGKLEGAKIGSQEIWLHPGSDFKKELNINIETAGSIGLVLQSLLLAGLKTKELIHININGGSVASAWSPPILYLQKVLLPILRKMGYHSEVHINKYGFYPSGGAKVKAMIHPCKELRPFNLIDQGFVEKIEGMSIATKHLIQPKVAERQKQVAERVLKEFGYKQFEIDHNYVDSVPVGSYVVLWAKTSTGCLLGADYLGERGKTAEFIGGSAGRKMVHAVRSGSTMDEHISDMILPYMAIAHGESQFLTSQITTHAKTNMWVIEKFLDVRFEIKEQDKMFLVKCVKRV
jgi:RNA 3'-terminal phosphate cyclase (ATP)/RNA 3'-terminal phosphate cyclase (GTP)